MSELKKILYTDRLPTSGDVEVFLWYWCSLSCDFCKQDHKDCTGMNIANLEAKGDILHDFFEQTESERVITTILGGEIFDKKVPDYLLDRILHLFYNVHYCALSYGKHADFDCSTNLIYRDTRRVQRFFDKLTDHKIKVKLCASYDIAGRFKSKKERELFKINEEIMENYIDLVSFVMTKKTVQEIIDGFHDPYFDYLYNKYPLSFSQYNDNEQIFGQKSRSLKLRPDEPDLLKAISILSDRYPKIQNLQQWKIQASKKVRSFNSCSHSKIVILPDNTVKYCADNDTCSDGCLAQELAEKRNCLCCEYFGYCQIECFHSALDDRIVKVKPCLQKEIYDLLKETLPQNTSS